MKTAQAVGLPRGKSAVSKGPYFPSHPETPDHDGKIQHRQNITYYK